MSKVDEIVEWLKADPSRSVSITGHADKFTGNSQINLVLSEKRAKAVRKALISKGIDASRISYTFKGDTANPFELTEQNRVAICVVE